MQKKILVLNFGGIGDQILFFPVLETLRKQYQNPFITLVTESRSSSVKDITGLIDEVFVCNLKEKNGFPELLRLLSKTYSTNYDVVIASGGSPLISVILFLTGIKERIGYDNGRLSRLLLTRAVKLNKNQYAANMYHELVGGPDETKIPSICHSGLDPESPGSLAQVQNDNKKRIVIHPGASKLSIQKGIIKCWASDNWIELIEKLNSSTEFKVLLTGGPDDAEIMKVFKEKFPDQIAQTGSLKDFVNLLAASDILICVDSAPMHIGVGLRKRVIALFGPTDEKKLLPSGNELFTPIKNENAVCRPCLWDIRQNSCETSDCLKISPESVYRIVVR